MFPTGEFEGNAGVGEVIAMKNKKLVSSILVEKMGQTKNDKIKNICCVSPLSLSQHKREKGTGEGGG